MTDQVDILSQIRKSAKKKILFLPHAVRQMSRPDRMITPAEVRKAVESGGIVEDYPEDPRGHSCLILGMESDGRAVHVVCSPREDYLAIITAYLPDSVKWDSDFRTRRRP